MDITNFVVQGRDQALLYGDYSSYHSQLSKRLLNSRKKLGIVTKNRGKFQKKGPVTTENVAENHEYVFTSIDCYALPASVTNFMDSDMCTFSFSPASEPGRRP